MDPPGRYNQKRNLCRWKGSKYLQQLLKIDSTSKLTTLSANKLERASVSLILIAMRDGKELAWEEAAKATDPTASGEAFKQMLMKRKAEFLDEGYTLPARCQGRKPRKLPAEDDTSDAPVTPAKRSETRNPFKTPVKRGHVEVNAPKRKRSRKDNTDKPQYDSGYHLTEPMSPMQLRVRNNQVSYAVDDHDNVEPASDDESPLQVTRARRSGTTYKVEDNSDDGEYMAIPSPSKRAFKVSTATAPVKARDNNAPKSLLTLKLAQDKLKPFHPSRPDQAQADHTNLSTPVATRDFLGPITSAAHLARTSMPLNNHPPIEHGLAGVTDHGVGLSTFGIPSYPKMLLNNDIPAFGMQSFKSRNPFHPNNFDRLRGVNVSSGGPAMVLDWQANISTHMRKPGFSSMDNQVGGTPYMHGEINANRYNVDQSTSNLFNDIQNYPNTFHNDQINPAQLPDPFLDDNEQLVADAPPRINTTFDFGSRPTGLEDESDGFEPISRNTSFGDQAHIDSQLESEYVGWNQHLSDADPNQSFLVDVPPNNPSSDDFDAFVNMNDVAPQPMSDWF